MQKHILERLRESQEGVRRMVKLLLPTTGHMEVLYEHGLRATDEVLKGFSAVIHQRLNSLARDRKPGRGAQAIPVDGPDETESPRRRSRKAK